MSLSEIKTIIVVCCSAIPSMEEKRIVTSIIANVFNDNRKVFVSWFVNGDLVLSENDLIGFFTSVLPGVSSYPQGLSHSSPSPQVHGFGTNQPFTQEKYKSGSSQGFHNKPAPAQNQPVYPPSTGRFDFKITLPPANIVMLVTHLRFGRISNAVEDVEYWKPGFVVPDEMARDLFNEWSKKPDAELVILVNKRDQLVWQVNKSKGREWQKLIILHLDETLVLQTRIKQGVIFYADKDVFACCANFVVPPTVRETLKSNYHSRSNAELFIMSDSEGNLRSIVRDGGFRDVCLFLKK